MPRCRTRWGRLGFGFVECGTVTPRPQAWQPRPRLFRLTEDHAVINRMGFNNHGMAAAARNLSVRRGKGLVGINIGVNKDSSDRISDYARAFETLAALARLCGRECLLAQHAGPAGLAA